MGQIRKRVKHQTTLTQRLMEEFRKSKEAAEQEPLGSTARDLLLRRARQVEAALRMNDWLKSAGPERLE